MTVVTRTTRASGKAPKDDPVKAKALSNKKAKKSWNTMSHLYVKRFRDDDPTLTPGAMRDREQHPHPAIVELDPSGRSTCKLCGEKIPKGTLRLSLMLECHKGYRNLCTLHENCFWKHPETKKLEVNDIFLKSGGDDVKKEEIYKHLEELNGGKA